MERAWYQCNVYIYPRYLCVYLQYFRIFSLRNVFRQWLGSNSCISKIPCKWVSAVHAFGSRPCRNDSYKIGPVCQYIHLWRVFLRNCSVGLFFAFCIKVFRNNTKKWQSQVFEIFIFCLGNLMNEWNLDEKWNILCFNICNMTCFVQILHKDLLLKTLS